MIPTEDIWKSFHTKLRQFIRNRVSDNYDADEILQEVFIKIHSGIDSLKSRDNISGWVFQIARNKIIDYYRKNKKEDYADFSDHAEESFNNELNKIFEEDISQIIQQLSPIYSEALILTEYHGLTQVQLAKKLGISISGAKSRVQRGRQMIKDILMQCCHIEFDKYGNVVDYHPVTCCCCTIQNKK